ncbi:MAG: cation:proton antiporter [Bacillota bacterium]|nr:cation:proton antiporter [Bacillota bacterium]
MHLDTMVADLALILVAAGIVTVIFRKLKQPVVLGYIVAGFLISPNFIYLPTIVDAADISTWADIGVIFLMFGLGLDFSFKKLATVGGSAFTIVATVMPMMILVGAGVGTLLGWGKMDCIFLGGMLSMSSTMIILKSYDEYGLKNEKFAHLVLSSLVIEDIVGIFMLVVLSTISVGQSGSSIAIAEQIFIMILYLGVWIVVGIYVIPSLLKNVTRLLTDELILIFSIGICLLMVVIANLIGFSSALGAFLAGSILAGTTQQDRIKLLVKPVRDLFGAIFFVSVGMMIEPPLLIKYIVPIIILSLVVMFGQLLFSTLGILLSGQSLHTAIRGGFSMVQIGEFSFIVATLGMSLGVISDFLYPIIVCVSVLTAFATPVFIKNSEKFYRFLDRKLPAKAKLALRRNTSENQSRNAFDPDWNKYMKGVSLRTVVCSAILFLFYWVGTRALNPALADVIDSGRLVNFISAGIIILFMIPLVNIMYGTNNALFVKLWVKHRSNRLPLITMKVVRALIAACFVALVLRKIFHIPFVILVAIAAIPIFIIARSAWLNGVTINMEKRFAANFSEKILEKERKDRKRGQDFRWLNESMYVLEFRITDPNFRKSIYDFTSRRDFVVTIIRIIRGNQFINMPSAREEIMSGDILQMLGTWDEVDACTILLERDNAIEYTDADDKTLKDFMYGQRFAGMPEEQELVCVPIVLTGSTGFERKSIKNCGIRQQYEATIIGIERGALPIVSPDIDTILRKDDILWLIGGSHMVDKLIRGGLME